MGGRKRTKALSRDVYQAEESDPEEDKQAGQRYDNVDNFQYELPEDFEDEEIDEELAFTEEDKKNMAKFSLSKEDIAEAARDTDELTRDDFSDDDSEADRLYGTAQGNLQVNAARGNAVEEAMVSESDVDEIFAGIEGSSSEDPGDEGGTEGSDEEQPGDLELLQKAVQDTLGPVTEHRKRVRQKLQDEAVPESEFSLPAGGGAGKVTLSEMLAQLGPQKGSHAQAHKQLAQLAKKAKAVEPPLPGPIRARKERQAGYEDTKKDVTKWTPIVRVNREAPTLLFANPANDVPKTSSTAALVAKFQPESKMEAEVAALLKASGASSERQIEEAEEEALALQTFSAEDLAKRHDELAKMRSLLFRHEEKAKHLAKIKSKDYHRKIKKSARLKAEKAGEMGDTEFIRFQAEKAEYERAKERLTLKHKNTSQWARRALKRGVDLHPDGKKEAIAEQLRLGEELRRKVDRADAINSSDDSSQSGSETGSSDSDDDAGMRPGKRGISRKTASKLECAATGILEGSDDEAAGSKGLFALPFMRRAQEKRKQAAQEEARQLLAELDGEDDSVGNGPSLGRRNFGLQGGIQANDADLDEELLDANSGLDMEEDAEERLSRLRQAAGLDRQEATANTPQAATAAALGKRKGKGSKAKQKAGAKSVAAEAGMPSEEEKTWQGFRASTEGPAAIADDALETEPSETANKQNEPHRPRNQHSPAGLLDRTAAGQNAIQARAYLLSANASSQQNGHAPSRTPNLHSRKRKAVSIGPAHQPSAAFVGAAEEDTLGRSVGQAAALPFLSSKSFEGEKAGYRFGKGPKGVGYYIDDKSHAGPQSEPRMRGQVSKTDGELEGEGVDDAIARLALALQENGPASTIDNEQLQRDIIAQAFAGDNVLAEFEAEKEAEAEKELPKLEAPSAMPGWGAWASSQKEPRWLVAARAKAEQQKQAARAGRKDAKLRAVSIAERYDKKAAKYTSTALPYPYTSKEAFEGSMRQPLGSDFNSQHSFREMTKPPIIKTSGVIIQPLKYSEGAAEEQRRVQKTKNGSRQSLAKVSGGMAQHQKKRR